MRTRSSCARGVIMKGICLRCTTKPHTDNEFVCNHFMPHAGDWPQSRFPDVPETPEQVSMDVPETSKASTGEPESPKQASTGEPESPKQASTGVPQTPSSSEPRWQEGKDIAADTGHGCPGAHTICPGVATMHAQEFRHWCRFCRRRRYAKASVGNGGRDIVQRFQEWALPYLVDTKGENHLFQQVRVAVGPRIEEFAGIPCHVLKAVGREWLEDRALLKSVSCICSTRTVQTEQVKTENGRYKNLPRSNAREHDRLPFVAPAPQKRFSAAASSEFASPVVPHSKVCQLGLEIQSHACDATLSRSGKKLSYQAQASIQPDEVRRDCPTYYGKTTQIEGVATAKLLLAGSSVTHGAHGTHASIQNASRPTFGRLQFCCYKGGGYENEQSFQQICFFCGNNVPPYKPYHLEDKYGTHCVLCRRYTCSACCQWELGKPYCTWCAKHGPRISVDHRRMNSRGRAVSRSCKAWKETVDWLDMLEFVRDSGASLTKPAVCSQWQWSNARLNWATEWPRYGLPKQCAQALPAWSFCQCARNCIWTLAIEIWGREPCTRSVCAKLGPGLGWLAPRQGRWHRWRLYAANDSLWGCGKSKRASECQIKSRTPGWIGNAGINPHSGVAPRSQQLPHWFFALGIDTVRHSYVLRRHTAKATRLWSMPRLFEDGAWNRRRYLFGWTSGWATYFVLSAGY